MAHAQIECPRADCPGHVLDRCPHVDCPLLPLAILLDYLVRRPVLAPQQQKIMFLLTKGYSNKRAAREMGLSVRTIEHQRARVLAKFNCATVAEFARFPFVEEWHRLPDAPESECG